MVKKALVVGVDVGKDNLAVAFIAPSEKEAEDLGEWSNRRKNFSALAKKLQKIAQKTESDSFEIVIEPTGGYEKLFVQFCIDQDWKVKVVAPYRVRQWAKSHGEREQKQIRWMPEFWRCYGRAHELPDWAFLPEEVEKLGNLLLRIDQVKANLRQEKNRQHALKAKGEDCGPVAESLQRHIQMLDGELSRFNKTITQHLKEYPELKKEQKRLKEVPGIGDKNSVAHSRFSLSFSYSHCWTGQS